MRTAWTVRTALVMVAVAGLLGVRQQADPQPPLKQGLDTAIDDERHAIAFYEAVMAKHGERRPFSNIVHAERRHEAALLGQYERLGLTPPGDAWAGKRLHVPDSFAETCDASAVAEVRNVRIYDQLIGDLADEQLRGVYEQLRWASLERHLPAFRRHGSGWEAVQPEALNQQQLAQRDTAFTARDAMFSALFGELMAAMRSGGPAEAIEVCSKRATVIAAEVAGEHGVRIGRTSWKLRNPENRPPVWAELLIDERPDQPRFMADRSGRLGALTPIRLAATCLQCHGAPEKLAPEVRTSIALLYPDDQATGFREGDLRGWFWIEAPPQRQ